MTVKELMEELKHFPPDWPVFSVSLSYDDGTQMDAVVSVSMNGDGGVQLETDEWMIKRLGEEGE